MIKILIADDHAVFRRGLKEILEEDSDMSIAGEAANGHQVLDKIRTADWDVVILDLSMPGKGGLDTLIDLKRQRPKLPVLVLSMHSEDQYAARVLRSGASGYLTKEAAPDELVRAVKKVVAGGKYVSSYLAERLAVHLETDTEKPLHMSLSDREYQVLCMIASGKSVTEIGKELSLSVKSISTYRARILGKMQMRTNAQLTHYAIKGGLVD